MDRRSFTQRKSLAVSVDPIDRVYEVEKIVDHRVVDGELQFYVKWKDYDWSSNTWEPDYHIFDESVIRAYNFRKCKEGKDPLPVGNSSKRIKCMTKIAKMQKSRMKTRANKTNRKRRLDNSNTGAREIPSTKVLKPDKEPSFRQTAESDEDKWLFTNNFDSVTYPINLLRQVVVSNLQCMGSTIYVVDRS
ncbi:hypothetical protein ACOME3_009183 [Neoechinorhynchus agilis]